MTTSTPEIVPSEEETLLGAGGPSSVVADEAPQPPPVPSLPKINPTVKAFIAPMVMLGLTRMGIKYDDPLNILIGRTLYGVTHLSLFLVCVYIGWRIWRGDTKEGFVEMVTAIQKTGRKRSDRGTKTEVEKKSFRDYDMAELRTLVTTFSVGVAATLALHLYMKLMPALILQIIMQPISFYENSLVAIYVFGYDVKRPFKVNKPPSLFGSADPAATPATADVPSVTLPVDGVAMDEREPAEKSGARRRKVPTDAGSSQDVE